MPVKWTALACQPSHQMRNGTGNFKKVTGSRVLYYTGTNCSCNQNVLKPKYLSQNSCFRQSHALFEPWHRWSCANHNHCLVCVNVSYFSTEPPEQYHLVGRATRSHFGNNLLKCSVHHFWAIRSSGRAFDFYSFCRIICEMRIINSTHPLSLTISETICVMCSVLFSSLLWLYHEIINGLIIQLCTWPLNGIMSRRIVLSS